ncbi:hypothetical protein ACQJBY_068578 [Aegilops geniculata]
MEVAASWPWRARQPPLKYHIPKIDWIAAAWPRSSALDGLALPRMCLLPSTPPSCSGRGMTCSPRQPKPQATLPLPLRVLLVVAPSRHGQGSVAHRRGAWQGREGGQDRQGRVLPEGRRGGRHGGIPQLPVP